MAEIILHSGEIAMIDDEDFALVSQYVWYMSRIYAIANIRIEIGKWKQISMHRLITNCDAGMYVDHIDGDGLNNRRKNLRVCTPAENGRNRHIGKSNKTGYKGVSYCNKQKKWYASIKLDGKSMNLGYHASPENAYDAYKSAAQKLHGEFARF